MSDTIETHRIIEFQGRVQHLVQQKTSRLRGRVSERGYSGKQAEVVRQFGSVVATKKQGRHAELPVVSVPTARRWVVPTDYAMREFEDDTDRLRTQMDSSSEYAMSFAQALGRAIDDEIIEAATGVAVVGETGGSSESFDATNQQIASGSVSLTIEKLRAAKEKFWKNEVDLENEPLYCCASAQELRSLLSETQAISLDYNDKPVLVQGEITQFMGFNFIHTERLEVSGTDRRCFSFVPSGLHLGVWKDVRTPVDWLPERDAWQTAGLLTIGATRCEQEKIVDILCSTT